ncbi:MAG: DUF928 domain-containing protein, partial [Campylobacterota bacterium]|nr:DUF928 domain-containing protein [Campylobacterota bacterium]
MTRGMIRGMIRGVTRDSKSGFLNYKDLVQKPLSKSENKILHNYKYKLPLPKRIEPLLPKELALTVNKKPNIYFYISAPWDGYSILTVSEQRTVKPILETYLPPISKEGIYSVSLKDYDISLKDRVEYIWSVSFISNMSERMLDMIISSAIMYKEESSNKKYWLDHYDIISNKDDEYCKIQLLEGKNLGATIEYLEHK